MIVLKTCEDHSTKFGLVNPAIDTHTHTTHYLGARLVRISSLFLNIAFVRVCSTELFIRLPFKSMFMYGSSIG